MYRHTTWAHAPLQTANNKKKKQLVQTNGQYLPWGTSIKLSSRTQEATPKRTSGYAKRVRTSSGSSWGPYGLECSAVRLAFESWTAALKLPYIRSTVRVPIIQEEGHQQEDAISHSIATGPRRKTNELSSGSIGCIRLTARSCQA